MHQACICCSFDPRMSRDSRDSMLSDSRDNMRWERPECSTKPRSCHSISRREALWLPVGGALCCPKHRAISDNRESSATPSSPESQISGSFLEHSSCRLGLRLQYHLLRAASMRGSVPYIKHEAHARQLQRSTAKWAAIVQCRRDSVAGLVAVARCLGGYVAVGSSE